jgi:hypothetical protein
MRQPGSEATGYGPRGSGSNRFAWASCGPCAAIHIGRPPGSRPTRSSSMCKRHSPVPVLQPFAMMLRRQVMKGRATPADARLCPGEKPGDRNSGLLSFEALQARADRAWSVAKLERITAHERRHTFVGRLAAAGVPTWSAASWRDMGCAMGSQGTTRCPHAMPDGLEEARRRLEALSARPSGGAASGRQV